MTFAKYLLKRSVIMVLTLIVSGLITVALVGSAMDGILIDSIRKDCADAASKINFHDVAARDKWIRNCIEAGIKGI